MKIKLKMTYNPTMQSNLLIIFGVSFLSFFSMHLNQGSADFFSEGLERKYFKLCEAQGLCLNNSTPWLELESSR